MHPTAIDHVPVPEGLNLDEWIHEPPPETSFHVCLVRVKSSLVTVVYQAGKGGNIFFFEDPTAAAVKSFFDEPAKTFQEPVLQSPQEVAARKASRHENNPFYLPEGETLVICAR